MQSMDQLEPAYIAEQVRWLRRQYRLTQENLAEMAGLTSRTIEKVESGRHRPDVQTLRSIARVFNLVDLTFFRKPSPEQMAAFRATLEKSLSKTAVVKLRVMRSPAELLRFFTNIQALRLDKAPIEDTETLTLAAKMEDYVEELMLIGSDASETDRISYMTVLSEMFRNLESRGYCAYGGRHRQRQRIDKGYLVFEVGVLALKPVQKGDPELYGLVTLEPAWETVPEDRPPMTG